MWKNDLATLDGEVTLTGTRLYGRRVVATTDFARATMDGVVSTSFSLVGSNDNPLRWLEAIDGTAGIDVDLAKLDQALPGMLPLRDGAELLSGRAWRGSNPIPAHPSPAIQTPVHRFVAANCPSPATRFAPDRPDATSSSTRLNCQPRSRPNAGMFAPNNSLGKAPSVQRSVRAICKAATLTSRSTLDG